MAIDIDSLRTRAIQIRDAKEVASITPDMVGGLMDAIIELCDTINDKTNLCATKQELADETRDRESADTAFENKIGAADGIAELDESGQVPAEQLPDGIVSREYSVDFEVNTDVASEGNIVNTLKIEETLFYNIASLQCVYGGVTYNVASGTLETPLIIPPLTTISWVVVRNDNSEPASVTFKYKLVI